MSLQASKVLEHKFQDVVPNMFESLVGQQRMDLLEVMCEPDSLLTSTFQSRTGRSDSACRCSLWCGHDLSNLGGLAVTLEQIRTLKPRHVWIAAPSGPFSPLQCINQRTPAQIQDLKAKRANATRIYESTLEIVKVCLQLGIHVSVEMSERSEAWRLPVFQRLRFHMGLHTSVVKGSSVGLRGQDGQLMQKGWRIVTSHARLADVLHKPCRCISSYRHAKCEGSNARSSGRYTEEFCRLVFEGLKKEAELQGIVQECSGESSLQEEFGLGLRCTCEEQPRSQECGSCMVQRTQTEETGQGFMSDQETQKLEAQARDLTRNPEHCDLNQVKNLLEKHPLRNTGCSRRQQAKETNYVLFGVYAYGNHYGLTNRTQTFPNLCKYINKTLKKILPSTMQWSSFVINHGSSLPVHRDCHNSPEHPNASIGFGDYSGGGLWIEGSESLCGRKGRISVRTNGRGEVVEGCEYDIQLNPVLLSPKAWHGTCAWEGDRWVITVFVSRGHSHMGPEELSQLKNLGFPMPKATHEAYPATQVRIKQKTRDPDETIKKQLYLLHCATGHSHPKHMIQALKRRGADERTLKLAEDFKCSVCQEKRRPQSRNLATLEPLPPKLSTVSADIGHWVHPQSEESVYFMVILDEGSRFRTARILSKGPRQAPKAQQGLHYLQEGWVQYFGYPKCLRLDPAGAFRSQAVEDWCDRHSLFLDIVPGEAHWKIGACENAVHGIKEVTQKLCLYDPDLSVEQALSEATTCFNHKELVRGFSPAQHVLGQAPDETGRYLTAGQGLPPDLPCENGSGEFARAVELRSEAEKAISEWQAQQRILRAKHSRHRPCYDYQPGELVFYWRCQDANKGRRQPGGKHGRLLGPARILATESRRDESGNIRPGGAVWLVKGRSLLKCSPEQLRQASEREELIEAMVSPSAMKVPWTYHMVAEEIGGNRYEDISAEVPEASEWERAQDPTQETQPSRFSRTAKRVAAPLDPRGDMEEMDLDLEAEPEDPRARERSRSPRGGQSEPSGQNAAAWWCEVKEQSWPEGQCAYWSEAGAAVEIEIAMPNSRRSSEKAWNNLASYFVGSLRRRAVELSERRMTAEEREAFRGAKAIEVKNFVASEAFEVLPEELRPDRSQAIGMRWILTWKLREDGSRKPNQGGAAWIPRASRHHFSGYDQADTAAFTATGGMEGMASEERRRYRRLPSIPSLPRQALLCAMPRNM